MAERDTDRRAFLALLAAWAATPLWTALSGCSEAPKSDEAGPLRLPLSDLPVDQRVVVEHGDRSLELLRDEAGVRARVLLCTHQGCNIRWSEADQVYICTCHQGRFNDDGVPVYGPPRRPLKELPVTLTSTEAVIGG